VNVAKDAAGTVQLAGLLNHSSGEVRRQVSGLLNKAGKVRGIQIAGLLNNAESSDYPISLVNLIKNGQKSLTLGANELTFANITFRSGGRELYGMLGLAYQISAGTAPYAFEIGFGLHNFEKNRYSMDTEFVTRIANDFDGISNIISSLKFLQAYALGDQFRLITGPTLNFGVLDAGGD